MSDFLKKDYKVENNIYTFKIEDSSTNKVTSFYKESPFPNYKDTDDRSTILEKGDKNRARDYCDMGIGYVALKKEKGFDGEDLLENVKINLWLERFWMLLENNKLLL